MLWGKRLRIPQKPSLSNFLGKDGVGGSIPLGSTIFPSAYIKLRGDFADLSVDSDLNKQSGVTMAKGQQRSTKEKKKPKKEKPAKQEAGSSFGKKK